MSLDKKKQHHKSRWSKIRIAGLPLFVCPLWDNVEKKTSKWTFITRPAKLKGVAGISKKGIPVESNFIHVRVANRNPWILFHSRNRFCYMFQARLRSPAEGWALLVSYIFQTPPISKGWCLGIKDYQRFTKCSCPPCKHITMSTTRHF